MDRSSGKKDKKLIKMGITIFSNALMIFLIFFISALSTGYLYRVSMLHTTPSANIFFFLIISFFLLWFYLCFIFMMLIYYRAILKMIPQKEGEIPREPDNWKWRKQFLRVIVNSMITALSSFIVRLFPRLLVLLGSKIGKNVAVKGKILNAELIELEDNVIIGDEAIITAHIVEYGNMIFKTVKICRGTTIGARSIIFPGVKIGANALVAANSLVSKDTHIPPGEIWGGIPAKKIGP